MIEVSASTADLLIQQAGRWDHETTSPKVKRVVHPDHSFEKVERLFVATERPQVSFVIRPVDRW
jgi:hypothetical protein